MNPRRAAITFLLLGLLGLGAGLVLFDRANPEATVRLVLGREEARSRAKQLLQDRGYSLGGYRASVGFEAEHDALRYFQKTLGIGETNRRLSQGLRLYRWHVRFFKPGEKTEYEVRLDPNGTPVRVHERLPEDWAGGVISAMEAEKRAREFMTPLGLVPPERAERIEMDTATRPKRTDTSVTFREKEGNVAEAEHRVSVCFHGDQLGGFIESYKVPEAFQRKEEALQTLRNTVQTAAEFANMALILAVIVVFILVIRRGRVPWKGSLAAGLALALLQAVAHANSFALFLSNYDPMQSFNSFVVGLVSGGAMGSTFQGASTFLLVAAGVGLVRLLSPGTTTRTLLLGPDARNGYGKAVLTGYGLAGISFGYVTLFYLAGFKWFGFFAPLGIKYDDTLSTVVPWIYPLSNSLSAAFSEEFLYRVFAITALLRLTKSRLVAVVLPAVAWAFGHTFYDVEPVYVRGLEITADGVLVGWVFLRFGLLPCLIYHYAFDAGLMGQLLLRSGNPYYVSSGLGVIALALTPALLSIPRVRGWFAVLGRRRGTVERPGAPPALSPAVPPPPRREPSRPLLILLPFLALALLVGSWSASRSYRGSLAGPVSVSKEDSLKKAVEWLAFRGVDPAGYKRVDELEYGADGWGAIYLVRNRGVIEARRILKHFGIDQPIWSHRWFKPQDKHSISVSVNQRGEITRYRLLLPEEEPGKEVDEDAAHRLAETARREWWTKGQLGDRTDTSSQTEKLPARRDYSFYWTERGGPLLEAEAYTGVGLGGDRLSGVWSSVRAPEKFVDQVSHERSIDHVFGLLGYLGFLFNMAIVIYGASRQVRGNRFAWKAALAAGLGVMGLHLASEANRLPLFWSAYAYDTSSSPILFAVQQVATGLLGACWGAFSVALLIGTGWTAIGWSAKRPGHSEFLALVTVAALIEIQVPLLNGIVGLVLHADYLQPVWYWTDDYSVLSAFVKAVGSGADRGLRWMGMLGLLLVLRERKPKLLLLWPAIYFLLVAVSTWETGNAVSVFAVQAVVSVLPEAAALGILLAYGGYSRSGIFLMGVGVELWGEGWFVFGPDPWTQVNGAVCLAGAVVVVGFIFYRSGPAAGAAVAGRSGSLLS